MKYCFLFIDKTWRKWRQLAVPGLKRLTYRGLNKVAAVLQMAFAHTFSWREMFGSQIEIHLNKFLGFKSTIRQHWFRLCRWKTSRNLNQCWPRSTVLYDITRQCVKHVACNLVWFIYSKTKMPSVLNVLHLQVNLDLLVSLEWNCTCYRRRCQAHMTHFKCKMNVFFLMACNTAM